MKNLSQHAEWLRLIEISGPFLSVSMLEKAFPQGLEAVITPVRQHLRAAYDEWCDAVEISDPLLEELHNEWIRLVLMELLEYDQDVVVSRKNLKGEYAYKSLEHGVVFSPDLIIKGSSDERPRLLVSIQPPKAEMDKVQLSDTWPASIIERMILLCRETGVRLGLITNGDRWMLVNAPIGSISSHASWYSRLWFQESITLKAFQSLLGVRRCFGPTEDSLAYLLEESLKNLDEVTDTLGEQVRRAVEVLVQSLDKADEDRNRELLLNVPPAELYEAGLTVMMRLVFVLCAEERELLLLGDPIYDQCYAVSTLRGQLTEEAAHYGPEILERRHDAWSRLLAVFRAIYSGIEHESLRMPALGGSLFDPDRFPFLEGRAKGTQWADASVTPLPINNRTVLMLLDALQVLEQRGGALLLSYRALDVEQIGHVYEGLLDHTVVRASQVTLGLIGSQKAQNPNLSLSELESALMGGEHVLLNLLISATKRSEAAIRNALAHPVDDDVFGMLISVCVGDGALAQRVRPFANLLRRDSWDYPIVYRENSLLVTLGTDRRETGTHYTPKCLTESIISNTLEPVAYVGPAEGKSRKEWQLKSAAELLDLKVCDPAMGSGAFLVQACRWLAERLVDAWATAEACEKMVTADGEVRERFDAFEPMPTQFDDRLIIARRLIAERCLYGVDINPLAVELAKLSIWLVTMAKGRPFGFLDHNLRSGDSLLGIHRLDQLTAMSINPCENEKQLCFFEKNIEGIIAKAIELRKKLRETPIRDVRDVEAMALLEYEVQQMLKPAYMLADVMMAEVLREGGKLRNIRIALDSLATYVGDLFNGNIGIIEIIVRKIRTGLSIDLNEDIPPRKPFHWPLEFPEVFIRDDSGFNAIVGNPPYMRGHDISGCFGVSYRAYLTDILYGGSAGFADLCAFFVLRIASLLRDNGSAGIIATNSISEGDTRRVSLETVCSRGFDIIYAEPNLVWPGSAAVTVSPFVIWNGNWNEPAILSGIECKNISPALKVGESQETFQLQSNANKCFVGSYIRGDGFILNNTEAETLLSNDPSNSEVVLPYLNGSELSSFPNLIPQRQVICFWDWPLEKARKYRNCFQRIERFVKPIRDTVARPRHRDLWWIHAENRPGLYHAIGLGKSFDNHPRGWNLSSGSMQRVIAKAKTSDTWAFVFCSASMIFDQAITVIASDSYEKFAVVQSSIHEVWARRSGVGSTMKNDLRYSPTMFETFPFPVVRDSLASCGVRYYNFRSDLMLMRQEGLTKTYNRFNDPCDMEKHTQILRNLQMDLDNAAKSAYGWNDIDLDHGFHETNRGLKFTISEAAKCTVLERLVRLNQERHSLEVQNELQENQKNLLYQGNCRSKKIAVATDRSLNFF